MNSNSRIISTDEDPSLRNESSAIINLRGVSTKLNKYKFALKTLINYHQIFVLKEFYIISVTYNFGCMASISMKTFSSFCTP